MKEDLETCRRKTFWGWFLVTWAVVDLGLAFVLALVVELKIGPRNMGLLDVTLHNAAMISHVGMVLAGMILLNTRPRAVRDDFESQAKLTEARADSCTAGVLAGGVCYLIVAALIAWLIWSSQH